MPADRPINLPLRLITLDLLGTLLLVSGLLELFNKDSGLIPVSLHFPYYEWALIFIGLLIMLPAVYGLVRHIIDNRHSQ
ncbi:MAG: DUF1418 family protein [Gammaproteobacteria bacterium]|nr:DUF1418 family protein [Gammaproteobacteria bacterium]MDH3560726.1 DUF1418 family protein [Gammaproteobacteria bacterium]